MQIKNILKHTGTEFGRHFWIQLDYLLVVVVVSDVTSSTVNYNVRTEPHFFRTEPNQTHSRLNPSFFSTDWTEIKKSVFHTSLVSAHLILSRVVLRTMRYITLWTCYSLRCLLVNLLECKGGCSATSNNNMKLVHWSLMGRLLHLVQWGLGGVAVPPRCTKCNSPHINGQCINLPYCCMMVRCSAVLMCPFKG